MTISQEFADQGFLVINGTEGIAPAVILSAADEGATVAFTARPDCERDAEAIVARASETGLDGRVSYLLSDPADDQAVDDLIDSALERLPGINVLIHNLAASAGADPTGLADLPLSEWNQIISTELRLPFMIARRVTEEFLFNSVEGRIVYVAYSGEGVYAPGAFSIAHSGLRALTRCLTKEYGKRQLAYNGVVLHADGTAHAETDSQPVETVMFLASKEASFVNGELLDVTGVERNLMLHQLGRKESRDQG